MRRGRALVLSMLLATMSVGAARAADNDLAVGATRINGTVFLDMSRLDAQGSESTGADLKRFYFNVEHRFSPVWSVRATTDINWLRGQDPTDLWLKYAYLQGTFDKAFTLRAGAAPMPWSELADKWWGYRYIDPELVSRVKAGETSDWGVHALGAFGKRGQLDYAVSVVTGAGYKQPRLGNGPDVDARFSWQPSTHTVVALGTYSGTRGEDVDGAAALHVAHRWSALAAYADARWRFGAQYFRTDDWNRVLKPAGDRGHGWSAWASVQLAPKLAVFARHDRYVPSSVLDPSRTERYANAGIEWRARSWLRVAAVWKRTRVADAGAVLQDVREAGVYAQLSY